MALWTEEERESKSATRADYEAAVGLYTDGKFDEAELGFKKVLNADPTDAGAKAFLKRVDDHQHSPEPNSHRSSAPSGSPNSSPRLPKKTVFFTTTSAFSSEEGSSKRSSRTPSVLLYAPAAPGAVEELGDNPLLPPPLPGSLQLNTFIPPPAPAGRPQFAVGDPSLSKVQLVDGDPITLANRLSMKTVEMESVTSEEVDKPLVPPAGLLKSTVSFIVTDQDDDAVPRTPQPAGDAPSPRRPPRPHGRDVNVKAKLWAMLVLMLAGPFAGLVVVSCIVLTRQSHALYDNKSTVVLSGLITRVKHFSRSVQAERAATVGYLTSGGVSLTELQQAREAVDRSFAAFEDYASQQVELPLPLVVRVAICQDIYTQREELQVC